MISFPVRKGKDGTFPYSDGDFLLADVLLPNNDL